jgi:Tfp pilus assembly protein PilW
MMIGATIGSFVLIGVLSTFLLMGRSGVNLSAYTTMDAQTRRALEELAQDLRMASGITWNSSTSITLTVPDNYTTSSNQVTYAWDTTTGSATFHYFYRVPGTASSGATRTRYIANITSFSYSRFDRLNAAASTDTSTKRIQLTMTISSTSSTAPTATDTTISASYVLRNKLSL